MDHKLKLLRVSVASPLKVMLKQKLGVPGFTANLSLLASGSFWQVSLWSKCIVPSLYLLLLHTISFWFVFSMALLEFGTAYLFSFGVSNYIDQARAWS